MGKLLVEDKEIVVPGQELAEGMDYLPGNDVFRDGEKLISTKLGITNVSGRLVKIVPLSGPYLPKRGDLVIGEVVNVGMGGWRLDIGWPFEASLSLKDATSDFIERGVDLSKFFDYGDYIVAEIVNVAGARVIDLSTKGPGLRRLGPGRILKISSTKVPRVIGKQGSMINMIKEYTGCKLMVGQNGIVWLAGEEPEKEMLAVKVIKKIEDESHISGLTDRIKEYFESEKNGV
ncbi:MAG TPA: exosome complex RNA-binding protein Rrp4 [Candidatus Nanoarchaeia archaeon]|nr:exosome complex RNA-binding protein Rrp4 [Candidatus Nanoarchaeia archaeon]